MKRTSMCLERAAEIVASLDGDAKEDTFIVFVEHFDLTDTSIVTTTDFAVLCGFGVLEFVKRA